MPNLHPKWTTDILSTFETVPEFAFWGAWNPVFLRCASCTRCLSFFVAAISTRALQSTITSLAIVEQLLNNNVTLAAVLKLLSYISVDLVFAWIEVLCSHLPQSPNGRVVKRLWGISWQIAERSGAFDWCLFVNIEDHIFRARQPIEIN